MNLDKIVRPDVRDARTSDTSNYFLDASASEPKLTQAPAANNPLSFYRRRGKRILDLAIVLAFAPAWVPLVLLLSLLARLDGGPAFFGHVRVGRGGEKFRCWKLRTMVPDAKERLASYLAENPTAANEWALDQKLTHDPRVTAIGRALRKSSLDELPQFINVLLGQMSLVGPRPVTEDELSRYDNVKLAYLSLRPGVTGLWQVHGRHAKLTYVERVELDGQYERSCSARVDLVILLRTIPAVLKLSGQ